MKITTAAAAAFFSLTLLAGCSSYPTENVRTLDNRPQLTFKTTHEAKNMTVSVDGIQSGTVAQYLEGRAALRVLPGTHIIRVTMPDGSVNTQKIFVSDGVTKTVVVQ